MLAGLYPLVNEKNKKKIQIVFKRIFKSFMRLPLRTPNKIIRVFIGNIEEKL